MSDIFISYKSEDRSRAEILAGALENLEDQDWSIWWDREILPGKRFDQIIEEELKKAKCIIVLWSKKSVESDWVLDEAEIGKRRGILVPVLIDDVKIPLGFKRIQAARLINWEGTPSHPEFARLLGAVCDALDKAEPEPDPNGILAEREEGEQEEIESTSNEQAKNEPKGNISRFITFIAKHKLFFSITVGLVMLAIVTFVVYLYVINGNHTPPEDINDVHLLSRGKPNIQKTDSGNYEVSFEFIWSKHVSIETLKFDVRSDMGFEGQILELKAETKPKPVKNMHFVTDIMQAGRVGELVCKPEDVNNLTLAVTVSSLYTSLQILEKHLEQPVIWMGEQPALVFKGQQPTQKIGSSYTASFDFDQSKPVPGLITFIILAEEEDKGKISDVLVETVGTKVGDDVLDILQEGKEATFTYQRVGVTPHRLKLTVSDVPLTVVITSHQLKEPINRTIKF